MTRAEALARYRPIRAGIKRVLRQATGACRRPDLTRAVKQVAPWAEGEDLLKGEAAEMLVDVALFEPNQRGRRVFDRFLAEREDHAGQRRAPGRRATLLRREPDLQEGAILVSSPARRSAAWGVSSWC